MSKDFSADISAIVKRTKRRTEQVCRAVKIDLFDSVIMDTRVDTGRMRGNFQTQENTPILTETDRMDKLPQGMPGGGAMLDVHMTASGDGVTYMTNNLPYVKRWEDEDAMVAKNMARIDQIVKKAAAN